MKERAKYKRKEERKKERKKEREKEEKERRMRGRNKRAPTSDENLDSRARERWLTRRERRYICLH